ncbi:siroheme decarboxylase subunit beta [Thalassotalea sp. PLHSN55]|uniref:siroheme decarboxylase subunit beta n=1 Tax=Thalassotalea sp. PLHSN55 TaxID=3435888 RepID=UPI003F825EDF
MSVSTCQSNALTPLEREYVLLTQNGMPVVAQPYHDIAKKLKISVDDVLAMTRDLLARGIIRRIAAVPNHYKLGYKFNGMTVWDIDDEQASKFGDAVGKLPFVSHCYLRPRQLPNWNFNLFAMVHGKTPEEIEVYRAQIKDLLADVLQDRGDDVKSYNMLTSTKILKKTGLRLKNKKAPETNQNNATADGKL